MIGVGVLPTLFAAKPDTETKIVGVLDETGELFSPLAHKLDEEYRLENGEPAFLLRSIEIGDGYETRKETADGLARSGEIKGYLILTPTVFGEKSAEYRSMNVGTIRLFERISTALRDVLYERELKAAGIDLAVVKDFSRSFQLRTVKLSGEGEEEGGFEKVFASAYIFMMMMFFLVMTSGQILVRSVVEEKTNRVVELLVSSCSARDLMAGKILGLSGLGFTQVAFWALIGLGVSLKFNFVLISLPAALLLLVYFVLGYLLYAAIFVAAGSPISTEQEAQQISSYLVMLLILPLVLAIPVLDEPDSLLVRILTFIPLITPTMMAMRIPVLMPSSVEIVSSIAILMASATGAMWVAGKIFRTAILAYGKRPSMSELFKLLRTAT